MNAYNRAKLHLKSCWFGSTVLSWFICNGQTAWLLNIIVIHCWPATMLTTLDGSTDIKTTMYFTNLLFILSRVFIWINFMYRHLYIDYSSWQGTFYTINQSYYVVFTVNAQLHEAPWYFLRWKLVQGCMYVQSAIPEMYEHVYDMVFHREYFTTVCLSRRCIVKKKLKSCCSLSENYECFNHLVLNCSVLFRKRTWTTRVLWMQVWENLSQICFSGTYFYCNPKEKKWNGH